MSRFFVRGTWLTGWACAALALTAAGTTGCEAERDVSDEAGAVMEDFEEADVAESTAQAASALAAEGAAASWLSPPPGCEEVELGELQNGLQLTPVRYGSQPTYRGALTGFGDPAVTDTAFVRLDSDTAPGLYSFSGGNDDLFTCEQCFWSVGDAGTAGEALFVASQGHMVVPFKVSPQQSIGALVNVALREAVRSEPFFAPYGGSTFVPGGRCLWVRFATWDTVRDNGCDPRAGSFTANLPGHTCVPDSYAADDGTLQRSAGDGTQGDACSLLPPKKAGGPERSDCAQGYACTEAFGDPACMRVCDYLSPVPGCGAGEVCGPLGLCVAQTVLEPIGFAFDPALVGEPCTEPYAEFCGVEGERGACVDLDGAGAEEISQCYRYERARSACPSGHELGYVSYGKPGGGFDRTYGFCYPADPAP